MRCCAVSCHTLVFIDRGFGVSRTTTITGKQTLLHFAGPMADLQAPSTQLIDSARTAQSPLANLGSQLFDTLHLSQNPSQVILHNSRSPNKSSILITLTYQRLYCYSMTMTTACTAPPDVRQTLSIISIMWTSILVPPWQTQARCPMLKKFRPTPTMLNQTAHIQPLYQARCMEDCRIGVVTWMHSWMVLPITRDHHESY